MSVINTHIFGQFWPVSWTITHHFGVQERFPRLTIPGVRLRVRQQHSRFLTILARFMDYYSPFCGHEAISIVVKPKVCLRVGHQHSQFWPILTRFVDYYSPFWGPKVISILVRPQGALMCRSSTLIVLADSGPFHGLLLTVFGSQSDFHD